jgi:hypothetical protein
LKVDIVSGLLLLGAVSGCETPEERICVLLCIIFAIILVFC